MIATDQTLENLTLTINQEIHVQASLDTTFAALLEQLGPGNETTDGKSLSMKIEPWPGGRWYRDLGDGNGHFWANVKAIVRPTLLEFVGPLFASFPFVSNVQYRLTEVDGGTLIAFRHTALGFVPEEQKAGMNKGWSSMHDRVRRHAEAAQQQRLSQSTSRK
jgi:Activator of Hsp90 ATPase homolog 1-like protein